MPAHPDLDRLRSLKTLPQLIAYLRDELDWPVDQDAVEDDVTFDYAAEELGFDAATAVHIKEIKQLRPLDSRQPWGVFWVNFEKKRLPVVMLRRILGNLVLKKRADAKKASQHAWHLHDLLFISAYGEESDRAITFAHFSQPPDSPGDLPILKVLGWDDGDTVLHLVDAHRTLAEKLRWPSKTTGLEDWRNQWSSAFTLRHREVITTTTELVEELARLADATRRRARTILARESERGPLRRLYAAFKAALIHDLTEDDFADVIAQTISYGLLIARFSRAAISAQNLVDMVPATNPFLRELLGTFLALAGRQSAFDFDELGIQDVVEVLNRSNADAVKADFGNRTRDEDPVIHFYEHFLAAYDRQKKIQRGVFYTPQPAVSYIVRGVHELLQKEFGIEDGLASTITWGEMIERSAAVSAAAAAKARGAAMNSPSPGGEGRGEGGPFLKLPKIRVPKAGKAEGEEVDLSPDEFFVLILDIATGTGTFLCETIEVIFQHLQAKWAKHGLQGMPVLPAPKRSPGNSLSPSEGERAGVRGQTLAQACADGNEGGRSTLHHRTFTSYWNEYVPAALLPRLYGYELMMAPYTIAHMKLALKFSEINTRLGQSDTLFNFEGRAHIYLTNTLEPPSGFQEQEFAAFFPALAHEAAAVNTVKRTKRFTVAMGNPPYAGVSANNSDSAVKLVDAYKFVDGEPLGERKHWLQDDYKKFIRIAQIMVESSGTGIVGYITNHGYLDDPTARGMRRSLMLSFPHINLLDAHGSLKKREVCPDGTADQNIFDIEPGVAIALFRRPPHASAVPQVNHVHLWGLQDFKTRFLAARILSTTDWIALQPKPRFYLFTPSDISLSAEYEKGAALTEVFSTSSVGCVTARDALTIHWTPTNVWQTVTDFGSLSVETARTKYDLGKDVRDWTVEGAQRDVRSSGPEKLLIVPLLYRPFDERFTYYTGQSRGFIGQPQPKIMRQFLKGENLGLCVGRQGQAADTEEWSVVFCTKRFTEFNLFRRGGNCLNPLYVYPNDGASQRQFAAAGKRNPNLSPSFLRLLAASLGIPQSGDDGLPKGVIPEDIFHYAYGVFHSPGYRSRYAEFLKIDFPRLPLTGNLELFRALAHLGGELVALHLLEFEAERGVHAASPSAHPTRPETSNAPPDSTSKRPEGRAPLHYAERTEFIGGRSPEVEKLSWTPDAERGVHAASPSARTQRMESSDASPDSTSKRPQGRAPVGTVWLDKEQTIGFKGVREDVWNFHIGGYQVCEKWLKDRKGRTLTKDDLTHYQKIVVALSETIRLMAEIDALIAQHGGWPLK